MINYSSKFNFWLATNYMKSIIMLDPIYCLQSETLLVHVTKKTLPQMGLKLPELRALLQTVTMAANVVV